MDALFVFDVLRSAAGALLIAGGLTFITGGAIGLLRFPDLYTRLHAASAADATGAVLFLVGLAIVAQDWGVALRLGLLAALLGAAGPALTHFVASAAHAAGLAPIAGRYAAPRPGRAKQDPRT
jgi:multicomponent Na+:H+ antiporter subunit G